MKLWAVYVDHLRMSSLVSWDLSWVNAKWTAVRILRRTPDASVTIIEQDGFQVEK